MTIEAGVAPEQSWKLLRRILPRRLQPLARGVRKRLQLLRLDLPDPYRTVYPYTQCHLVRQQNVVRLASVVEEERIDGAVVECGVLDGGMAALMAWATAGSRRPVHLFDSWQGLPATTAHDGAASGAWAGDVVGSPARVLSVMQRLRVDRERLHLHRGWFADTFPRVAIDRIALLHVDPDFYDPVRLALERWYPHVVPGGFVQFDDYDAFSGARRAVDEFLAAHPEVRLETAGDGAKAYFLRKP